MKRFLVAGAILLSLAWLGTAYGQFGDDQNGVPGCGSGAAGGFASGNGVPGGCGNAVPQPGSGSGGGPGVNSALLLEDGASFLLLEDVASKVCFEGGC